MFEELIITVPGENAYRIFRMVQKGDKFEVYTGRAGFDPVYMQTKSMKYWDEVYNRKIAEGYTPRTKLVNAVQKGGYKPIENKDVRNLFAHLLSVSRKYSENTHVFTEVHEITEQMVELSQSIVDDIRDNGEARGIEWSNARLLDLLAATPRRTKNIEELLIGPDHPLMDVVAREQNNIDVLRPQVAIAAKQSEGKTILETFGLEVRLVTGKEKENIIRHMDPQSRHRFVRAFRVKNAARRAEFDAYCEKHGITDDDFMFLYHGSRNENVIGILIEGLILHPDAAVTGKALGYGIYLANLFKKSAGYTDFGYWVRGTAEHGYVAVFKVAAKNPLHTTTVKSYTKKGIAPHDIVYYHGGGAFIHDEFVVFDERQLELVYLIEITPD